MNVKIVVAQIGARQHYEIARMCRRSDTLTRLYTDFWKPLPRSLTSVVKRYGGRLGRRALGRSAIELPEDEYVTSYPLRGAYWYARLQLARTRAAEFDAHFLSGSEFAKLVARSLHSEDFTTFFGFSSASLESIEVARRLGKLTVLDEVAPYHKEDSIVADEQRRFPAWEPRAEPTPERYLERLQQEWTACDRIIVNSQWSRDALMEQGVAANKLHVVPISFQPDYEAARLKFRRKDEPLQVLWFGTLCLRKGLPYAIEAARLLLGAPVHFTFAGPAHVDIKEIDWPSNCSYVGAIPRLAARNVWDSHHVFLLPTLSDGFAITQVEAIAHGLPIIVTRNCGDVVEDGVTGSIVPARNARAIADAILKFVEGQIELAAASRAAAVRSADFSAASVWHRLLPILTQG